MSALIPVIPSLWRLPLTALALTILFMLTMTAGSVTTMVGLWWNVTTYHHCFLVLPIMLFFIWQKRTHLAMIAPRQDWLGLHLVAACMLFWLIGRVGQIQLFEHIALIGMTISLVVALLGREVARAIAFPLAFLLFMVPFGDVFVPALQQFTANFSVALLHLANIPVFHDGIMIETPSGLFEVAEACAGIRFLIANIMIGALFAYLALGRLWKWVLFMAIAVLLPIIANGFRAFGIILIAYLTDNEYAAGVDHLIYGWGFFAAIMLAFLAIGNAMADWPSLTGPKTGSGADEVLRAEKTTVWHPALAFGSIMPIIAAPLYASWVLSQGSENIGIDPKLMLDPTAVLDLGPACKADHAPSNGWRPQFSNADMIQGLTVDCGGGPVDLFFAYYAHEREGAELIQHGNRLADGQSWTRTAISWHAPDIEGLPGTLKREDLYGRYAGDRVVIAWYWIGGQLIAKDWQAKAYRLYRKLLGKDEPAALIALSAPYVRRADDALPDIETVLEQHKGMATYLDKLAPPTEQPSTMQPTPVQTKTREDD